MVETITRLVTEVVCTLVGFVLDLVGFLINVILSIPILGGIIRTIINWVTEIIWRIVSLPDFLLSLAGIRIRKKMYVKLIILNNNGVPHTTEAVAIRGIQTAQAVFDRQCNVNLIYTGVCVPQLVTNDMANNIECGAGGFFSDWWIGGSYYELVSADCAFQDGWKRIVGYGAELIVFVIADITPRSTVGCSFSATHNYVVVEPNIAGIQSMAHEIGHACLLPHLEDAADVNNLMFPNIRTDAAGELVNRDMTNFQIASLRGSRHCTFI
ncbi:hypothetical protein GCM10007415_13300 [Parapedobacter pyrenivorans]|uniref:Uncharacterized protein n=1 Tax=Parapedobacter pyrenivorans TaxID=1305674 RepID=A0A917HKA0_9SPHI|nr:hypothetical protein GCM10007415_13300 [Parapedobacter pyrenivorans]